jgi:hypothetical protein
MHAQADTEFAQVLRPPNGLTVRGATQVVGKVDLFEQAVDM